MQKCDECNNRAWFSILAMDSPYMAKALPWHACRRHVATILIDLEHREGEPMRVERIYFPGC